MTPGTGTVTVVTGVSLGAAVTAGARVESDTSGNAVDFGPRQAAKAAPRVHSSRSTTRGPRRPIPSDLTLFPLKAAQKRQCEMLRMTFTVRVYGVATLVCARIHSLMVSRKPGVNSGFNMAYSAGLPVFAA